MKIETGFFLANVLLAFFGLIADAQPRLSQQELAAWWVPKAEAREVILKVEPLDGTEPTEPLLIQPNGMTRSGSSYEFLNRDVLSGGGERRNNWFPDPKQSDEWRARHSDYENSGYDIGHNAPCDDFGSQHGKDASFNFSNAGPQEKHLNRGIWLQIENQVRTLAQEKGVNVIVWTGPLYRPDDKGEITIKTIGKHQVWVGTDCAKAVLVNRNGKYSMIAWICPNFQPLDDATADQFRSSVDEIEFAAGRDLFAWLPVDEQKKLEANK